ncbi:uncharacterized protein A1O9_03922 [Exophiala aquamarina CBS 119918]|uniref:Cation/H+ exchanger transmembrane domain-containing protein n=1 Tax=Exophiala aquamarina CBS 119918 TaxID=1182545 RepID=A0A072PG12_9EURO|nr:uncharacterized protein A1O9_03922 [Exophiala aquamarina CBS 119918]KEF59079.1 hypothetical protein A1O9_03922 [Exophiala aquamarina CBS 119918]
MVDFVFSNFNLVCATFGGLLMSFGLLSYVLKQRFLFSEALISLIAGVIFSHLVSFIRPDEYTCGEDRNLDSITLEFSRLVLGVQLVLAGIQLPPRYLSTAWRSLCYLLGPGLTMMWLSAGLVIWFMLPRLGFMHALAIGACIAPTDPVLSNAIIKGRFADTNTPKPLQRLISAEAGLNDGLGYPFLFFSLCWIKYSECQGNQLGMVSSWAGGTWGYVIIFSLFYGFGVGYVARKMFFSARKKGLAEDEASLIYVIALSLFVLGTCGILGTDDILACFIAGCTFAWNDQFERDTHNELFWSAVDMMLNISIFVWYGAVAPWASFATGTIITLSRLIILGVLILLFRRLPAILVIGSKVSQIEHLWQAVFVGFFGPIGVSAIFYLMVSTKFLGKLTLNEKGVAREDIQYLQETMQLIVWFLAISSVVVHGLALPLAKMCSQIPYTSSLVLGQQSLGTGHQLVASAGISRSRIRDYFSWNSSSKECQARTLCVRNGYNTMEEG